jgi:hypothetical protein
VVVVVDDVVVVVVVGNGTVPHRKERGEGGVRLSCLWVGWRRKRQAREKEGWLILSACGACLPCKYLLRSAPQAIAAN